MQFSITSFGSVGEAVIFQLEGRGFDYTYSSFTRYPVASRHTRKPKDALKKQAVHSAAQSTVPCSGSNDLLMLSVCQFHCW